MICVPSRKTRMPSSARAVNVAPPPAKLKRPVQRTEKLSTGRPAGPPAPYTLLIVASHAVRVVGGVSATLPKYSAKNCPVGHPPAPVTVKASAFDACPSGLGIDADAVPAAARAVKVNVPAAKVNRPVQRAEKLSTGRPAGPPAP